MTPTYPSDWNSEGQFALGAWRLWVDGNGQLRHKAGAPTSDLDGAVVGPKMYVNVKEYGARGDNSTDDCAAINRALAAVFAQNAGSISGGGSLPSQGGLPTLYFPKGLYRISKALQLWSVNVVGNGAVIIQNHDTEDIFTSFQYGHCEISGISFQGGARAVYINTNAVADPFININNCDFQRQTQASIKVENSGSTHVAIHHCHFYTHAGHAFDFGACDCITVADCLLGNDTPDYLIVADTCSLHVRNCSGGPGSNAQGTKAWVKMINSASVQLEQCRFGGEPGAKTIVDVFEGAADNGRLGWLRIENCATYTATNPFVRFYSLPQAFISKNNIGDTYGFWFDPSMPESIKRTIGTDTVFDWDGSGGRYSGRTLTSGTLFARTAASDNGIASALLTSMEAPATQVLTPADRLRTILFNRGNQYTLNTAGAHVSATPGASLYGEQTGVWTADSSGQGYFFLNWETALEGLPTGIFTVVFDLYLPDHGMNVNLIGSVAQKVVPLPPGRHVVSFPFYYDATNPARHAKCAAVAAYAMPAGSTLHVGPYRVFNGCVEIRTPNTIVYASGPPTAERWVKGDVIHNSAPSAGSCHSWICVTTGMACTTDWTPLTPYTVGQHRIHDSGKVYECITAGTSAASGGPSGSGNTITDGSVTWVYRDVVAVFKVSGVIL